MDSELVARVWVLSKSTHCVGAQLGLAATPPPSPFAIDFKGAVWANVVCNSQRASNDVQRCAVFLMKYGICRVSTICKWSADCNSVSPAALVLIILARGQQFWMVYLIFWMVCWLSIWKHQKSNIVMWWYLDRRKCFNSSMQHNTGVYSTKLIN